MIGGDYSKVEGVSFYAVFVEIVEVVLCIEVAGFKEGVIQVHAFHNIVSPLDVLKGSRIKREVLANQGNLVLLLLYNGLGLFFIRIVTVIQLIA